MHSFYLPPDNLDLIAIRGAGAAKLLQGQLTCDVDAIPDPGFARGALCNNKGRVLATFILVRQGAGFDLALNKGLGDIVAAVLKKFLPFYKCEMRQAAPGESYIGIVGAPTLAALGLDKAPLPTAGACAPLADGWICNLDDRQQQYLVHPLAPLVPGSGARAGTLTDWLVCGLGSGQFPFVAGDEEKYTPQEIHLDRHAYVSFTKGCYTGQEIVARMHYRGKMKKLLFLLEAPFAGIVPEQALELVDANDAVLGTAMKVLQSADVLYALASLPAELENNAERTVKSRAGLRFASRVF